MGKIQKGSLCYPSPSSPLSVWLPSEQEGRRMTVYTSPLWVIRAGFVRGGSVSIWRGKEGEGTHHSTLSLWTDSRSLSTRARKRRMFSGYRSMQADAALQFNQKLDSPMRSATNFRTIFRYFIGEFSACSIRLLGVTFPLCHWEKASV